MSGLTSVPVRMTASNLFFLKTSRTLSSTMENCTHQLSHVPPLATIDASPSIIRSIWKDGRQLTLSLLNTPRFNLAGKSFMPISLAVSWSTGPSALSPRICILGEAGVAITDIYSFARSRAPSYRRSGHVNAVLSSVACYVSGSLYLEYLPSMSSK